MMPTPNQRIKTASTIRCCSNCVPPKRHTACWGHCPDYAKERAEYDEKKAAIDKQRRVSSSIYLDRAYRIAKYSRKHGR